MCYTDERGGTGFSNRRALRTRFRQTDSARFAEMAYHAHLAPLSLASTFRASNDESTFQQKPRLASCPKPTSSTSALRHRADQETNHLRTNTGQAPTKFCRSLQRDRLRAHARRALAAAGVCARAIDAHLHRNGTVIRLQREFLLGVNWVFPWSQTRGSKNPETLWKTWTLRLCEFLRLRLLVFLLFRCSVLIPLSPRPANSDSHVHAPRTHQVPGLNAAPKRIVPHCESNE